MAMVDSQICTRTTSRFIGVTLYKVNIKLRKWARPSDPPQLQVSGTLPTQPSLRPGQARPGVTPTVAQIAKIRLKITPTTSFGPTVHKCGLKRGVRGRGRGRIKHVQSLQPFVSFAGMSCSKSQISFRLRFGVGSPILIGGLDFNFKQNKLGQGHTALTGSDCPGRGFGSPTTRPRGPHIS